MVNDFNLPIQTQVELAVVVRVLVSNNQVLNSKELQNYLVK